MAGHLTLSKDRTTLWVAVRTRADLVARSLGFEFKEGTVYRTGPIRVIQLPKISTRVFGNPAAREEATKAENEAVLSRPLDAIKNAFAASVGSLCDKDLQWVLRVAEIGDYLQERLVVTAEPRRAVSVSAAEDPAMNAGAGAAGSSKRHAPHGELQRVDPGGLLVSTSVIAMANNTNAIAGQVAKLTREVESMGAVLIDLRTMLGTLLEAQKSDHDLLVRLAAAGPAAAGPEAAGPEAAGPAASASAAPAPALAAEKETEQEGAGANWTGRVGQGMTDSGTDTVTSGGSHENSIDYEGWVNDQRHGPPSKSLADVVKSIIDEGCPGTIGFLKGMLVDINTNPDFAACVRQLTGSVLRRMTERDQQLAVFENRMKAVVSVWEKLSRNEDSMASE